MRMFKFLVSWRMGKDLNKNGKKSYNNHFMKEVIRNALNLVELAPLINKESEILNEVTKELNLEIKSIKKEVNSLKETASQISFSSMENLKRVGIVNENVEHIKRSFKDTEQSMLFVKKAVDELVEATKEIYNTVEIISTLTKTINKIADKTKILALNASIEAVRAGQNGKGFAVIAQEVRELAQATTEATKDVTIKAKEVFGTIEKIKEKMCAIDHQVQRTYNLVCLNREKLEEINQPIKELNLNAESLSEVSANLDGTTATLSNTISKLSELIEKTTHSSSTLKTYSERLHSLSEEQILTVGKARVDLYDYAKEIIQEAASSFELRSMHRPTMENYLKRLIQQHEIFELLYITNDQGIQITDNIARWDFRAAYGSTGYGENWSSRPWFINVKESLDTYISDIYVSLATNSYCLTISCPIFDDKHRLIGVLGADLDLKKVIEGDRSLTQKINGLDKVDTKTLS